MTQTTQTTAVVSIGRDRNARYVTPDTAPAGTITHDGVTQTLRDEALEAGVTILAIADGVGEYEGETEPCTIAMVTGATTCVDAFAIAMAEIARHAWAQECIGYVRMPTPDWKDSTAWPA